MSKKKETGYYKWNKTNFIKKKIEKERNLDWYIKRYRRNINISSVFVVLSFLMLSISYYTIKQKSDNREIFITSTSGDVIHYKMTKEKRALLMAALKKINQNGNK